MYTYIDIDDLLTVFLNDLSVQDAFVSNHDGF